MAIEGTEQFPSPSPNWTLTNQSARPAGHTQQKQILDLPGIKLQPFI
jgi:hypothetical protein